MPRGDGTGPVGRGAMTGRGAGYCAGSGMPGFANPIPGRGLGAGFGGGGRGCRNGYWATGQPGWMRFGAGAAPYGAYTPADPEIEKRILRNQAESLQAQLDNVRQRLGSLEPQEAEG